MSRLAEALTTARAAGRRVLVPFITAGDPDLATTEKLIVALADAGADAIELGIPFSDPLADGPVIQLSNTRALAAGATLRAILDLVARVRGRVSVPLVLMGSINPIHAFGIERFARAAHAAGIDGVIIPDLPIEDGGSIFGPLQAHDLDTVMLVAPTTPARRLAAIGRHSRGFVYYVSLTGVTGERTNLRSDLPAKIRAVKRAVDLPVLVGFGISTPEQAAEVAAVADGVIVGSAVVRRVPGPGGARGACERVASFVRELRTALDRVPPPSRGRSH